MSSEPYQDRPDQDRPALEPDASPAIEPEGEPIVVVEGEPATKKRRFFRRPRPIISALLVLLVLGGGAALLAWHEAVNSTIQSHLFVSQLEGVGYSLEQGPADPAPIYPEYGPFDERMGYTKIPQMVASLSELGFEVTEQAQVSDDWLDLAEEGVFVPYDEKAQSGLTITGREGGILYRSIYPGHVYATYAEVPPVLAKSLAYIENKELLETRAPHRNPVIEWDRFIYGGALWVLNKLGIPRKVEGGSTLATQIEKFKHSPGGNTQGAKDKIRQMWSASLKVYAEGRDTRGVHEAILLEYLNGVPLAGRPGYGEIHGIGDGMWAWYGRDFEEMNDLLRGEKGTTLERARVLREALSLTVAQRGPTRLLRKKPEELDRLVDRYLREMRHKDLIEEDLIDVALGIEVRPTPEPPPIRRPDFKREKETGAVRGALARILGAETMPELDRRDVTVRTTLDERLQRKAEDFLVNQMYDPGFLKESGYLSDKYRLREGDPQGVLYSFTLYELRDHEVVLRSQVDTLDKPLNINESAKLDLGSTAKLRTTLTYLQLVADLWERWHEKSRKELLVVEEQIPDVDPIATWVLRKLWRERDISLDEILEDALDRKYSASPYAYFVTNGGVHRFANFNDRFNGRNMPIRYALRYSVNLPFVRLMQDLVRHYRWSKVDPSIIDDKDHPKRREYLMRYVQLDGAKHFNRVWNRYGGKSGEPLIEALVAKDRSWSVPQLAMAYRYIWPERPEADFRAFVTKWIGEEKELPQDDEAWAYEYERHGPAKFDLNDRAYITRAHPLELWLVRRMQSEPDLTKGEASEASRAMMPEIYAWFLEKGSDSKRRQRIRTILEIDAFEAIHAQWARAGYPFDELVPSLATALGTSADRPEALAELMGILVADGVRYPQRKIDAVVLAKGTPYEVRMRRTDKPKGVRVFAPEVAKAARGITSDVVQRGTARRARDAFDGQMELGGKTGTGDHRFQRFDKWGNVVSERFVNRTGTFTFWFGDRFFGVITVYVEGEKAADYSFTSSMAVSLFTELAPELAKLPHRLNWCGDKLDCLPGVGPKRGADPLVAELLPRARRALDATRRARGEMDDLLAQGRGDELGREKITEARAAKPEPAPQPEPTDLVDGEEGGARLQQIIGRGAIRPEGSEETYLLRAPLSEREEAEARRAAERAKALEPIVDRAEGRKKVKVPSIDSVLEALERGEAEPTAPLNP